MLLTMNDASKNTRIDFAAQREIMIASQLRPNRVTDSRILRAMLSVPREAFLPPALQPLAYMDGHLMLDMAFSTAKGRCLLAPMVFAQLLQLANIAPDDHILDIGCATGYSTAVIARLAGRVTALEENAELAAFASDVLAQERLANVTIIKGNLAEGAEARGPFDVIFLNGSVSIVPPKLLSQLGENGRLTAVDASMTDMKAVLFTKSGGEIRRYVSFDADAPQLPGFAEKISFVF